MLTNRVVVHQKDGTILKGTTKDFFPNQSPTFHLEKNDGAIIALLLADAKAIFFVKDFTGNKDRADVYDQTISGAGKKIRVVFSDGEEIVGYTQGYSPERAGFFLVPADRQSNSERIFVVKSSCSLVAFL